MTDTARALLDRIAHWGPLWDRHIQMPVSREEADEVRRALYGDYALRDINARGAN